MTQPIEIPTLVGFNSKVFKLNYVQSVTQGGGGFLQTLDRTSPMWMAEYSTPPLSGAKYAAAKAFFGALEGSANPFLGYDPEKLMPAAYANLPITADPWTAAGFSAPRVTATDYSNSTLALDRLATGTIITAGDLICFTDNIAWYLFEARSSHVVGGSTATVTVSPRPKTFSTLPYNIRYRKAVAAMKIIGGLDMQGSVGNPTSYSFKAFQYIERV